MAIRFRRVSRLCDPTNKELGKKVYPVISYQYDTSATLKEIAKEIVAADALDRVFIATDYFDASINRISAWVTGMRNVQKALLYALLTPHKMLKELQDSGDLTALMVKNEELKTLPFGDVWEKYLAGENVNSDCLSEIKKYEKDVLSKR